MGFLDKLTEVVNSIGTGSGGSPALLDGVVDLLKQNGVGGIVEQFREKGFTEVVTSWVGTGTNQIVSPEQIKELLGSEKLQQLAERAGVSPDNASRFLKEILPGLIDKLTPEGMIPADDPSHAGSGGMGRGAPDAGPSAPSDGPDRQFSRGIDE